MNLKQLLYKYDVKLVALNGKTRLSKKSQGYASFNEEGIITHPKSWKNIEKKIDNYGILCQYIEDLGLYLAVLDIDSKDFPVMQVLEKYPTSMLKTQHGYHLFFLSNKPIRYKQLIGKEKEICPVDLRGQRDESHEKEGNYTKLSDFLDDTTVILVVDFNEVIQYVYSLFGIEAKKIGEYTGNVKEWVGKSKMKKVTNKEKFIAYYLYNQKSDWSTGYPDAFPWGVRLKGAINEDEAYNIARFLMSISGYPRPKKWIKAFMTGFTNADDGKGYFGGESLPNEFKNVFLNRFEDLNENELNDLARYCKNVKLYEILEIIKDEI